MTKKQQILQKLVAAKAAAAQANELVEHYASQLLKACKPGEVVEIDEHRGVFVEQFKNVTAWKKVAEKAGASRQLITANTREQRSAYIKVSARKCDQKVA